MRLLTSLLFVTTLLFAQDYDRARDLVQRVQNDLQRLLDHKPRNDKERERIDNARRRLSDFDRDLRKNKFDKENLDQSIDHMKNLVDNNTLEPNDRDMLSTDLRDLRTLRAERH